MFEPRLKFFKFGSVSLNNNYHVFLKYFIIILILSFSCSSLSCVDKGESFAFHTIRSWTYEQNLIWFFHILLIGTCCQNSTWFFHILQIWIYWPNSIWFFHILRLGTYGQNSIWFFHILQLGTWELWMLLVQIMYVCNIKGLHHKAAKI